MKWELSSQHPVRPPVGAARPGQAPAPGVSAFMLRFFGLVQIPTLSPLGGEGGPPPAFSSAGAGRVRGSRASARPCTALNSPLKAEGW